MENLFNIWTDLNLPKSLTKAENLLLLKEYKATGDKKIKQKIFEGNLKLVTDVMKNWTGLENFQCSCYPSMEDLFQHGAMALYKAIDAFNLKNKSAFSTYATTLIRNSFKTIGKKTTRQKYISPKLVDSIGNSVSPKYSQDDKLRGVFRGVHQLPAKENEQSIINGIDKNSFDIPQFNEALLALPPEQLNLLKQIYIDDLSCVEIATQLGVSRESVNFRLHKILNKIRKNVAENKTDKIKEKERNR